MQAGEGRRQRVIGALVGSVVGDALGAPFEFGRPGEFGTRFPEPARGLATEMCGGKGWAPGEWTDDTQMAQLVAASLLERGELDEGDLCRRFLAWYRGRPKDVGISTGDVLSAALGSGDCGAAARVYREQGNRAAGNGSIMRTTPAAIFFARKGEEQTVDAARRISALTHGDPAAGDGCAIFHRLVAAALDGNDALDVLPDAVAEVPERRRARWETVLADGWTPEQATESNGAVWPTLGTAVWALRQATGFERAMRMVLDVGGDTDTLAAVTGGLVGARFGIQSIPSRWSSALNGELPGNAPLMRTLGDLQQLALRLDGGRAPGPPPEKEQGVDPVEVLPGLWLSDLYGAARAPEDAVVISLCRSFGHLRDHNRRQVYLTDNDENLDLDAVLADVLGTIEAVSEDGKPVLVHCYGGASRTGLVLRAYLMKTRHLSAEEATDVARQLWPLTATWNDSFERALRERSPA